MSGGQENRSNRGSTVARLMETITLEIEAMRRGLTGLSDGSSKHTVIEAKYNRLGDAHNALIAELGEEQANSIVVQAYAQGIEDTPSPS